jgi:hypothetical protein
MTERLAEHGWVVEVVLVAEDRQSDARFFAVGTEQAAEAESAVLRYPGILPADPRSARRRLSAGELQDIGLRTGAVRPYGYTRVN